MTAPLKRLIESRYGGRGLPVALVLPDGGRIALSPTPEIDLIVRSWRGVKALAAPALGTLARAYVHQDIDFTGSAKRALAVAESMAGSIAEGGHSLGAGIRGIWHRRRGNRVNIQHHYDVSNAFYRLWLDARMVYSCAYFRAESDTLDDAQEQKLDHICRKLRLVPCERFLDIGCGWGGLIFWAAQHYGVEATGITLSRNQHDYVTAEIAARGLQSRVRVELRDYLDLPEDVHYDKIASVGMFEHVGIRNFPRYFGKIYRILQPGGFVLNHGITHNWLGPTNLGSGIGDFVEEYVFPGGELAHVARVVGGLGDAGLEIVDAEALREHYAKTLWNWVERLERNADAARAEVGEEKFRVWRIYMAGSAHAFDRGWLSLWQLLAGKPLADGRLPHPLTRDFIYQN
ncbi:MAG TPA: cyclopropane-fatty-acyl-phospholipid synthase family protein [Casimicrobiaceae bacterium]|nr:cyclopropane-fatty-acyl-phospholipid synthase family protein [Casimicrobiaceae bacterium]